MDEDWISSREFARRVGVQPNAVMQAINNGRIERREDKRIHWPTQSEAWEKGRDPSKVRFTEPEDDEDTPDPVTGLTFQEAKARREIANVGLLELKLQKARGELVNSSFVRNAMAQFAIEVRDGVMQIPDRVAAEIAAELVMRGTVDQDTAREIVSRVFKREIRGTLETIARASDR